MKNIYGIVGEELEEKVFDSVVNFAKNDERIIKTSYGFCPEDGFEVIYFISNKERYDFNLSDKISKLSVSLYNEFGYLGEVGCVPKCNPEDYGFLGRVVWERD